MFTQAIDLLHGDYRNNAILSSTVKDRIDKLGIKHKHKPTRRGGRAGRNKPRVKGKLNFNNLIKVPLGKTQKGDSFQISLLNARSIRNKALYINEIVLENNIDILALTETWLSDENSKIIAEITPGYRFQSANR